MKLENDALYKIHGEFDISDLANRFKELDDTIWTLDTSRQAYGHGPHRRTNSIILNYCRGEPEVDKQVALDFNSKKISFDEGWKPEHQLLANSSQQLWRNRTYDDYLTDVKNIEKRMVDPQLNALTDTIVQELEKMFNGIAGLVLFVKLPAGAVITGHVDGGYYLGIIHRLHIPIITNDKVDFILGTKYDGSEISINMKPGILYEINNQKNHGVANRGNADRVHLIVDIIPHDKLP